MSNQTMLEMFREELERYEKRAMATRDKLSKLNDNISHYRRLVLDMEKKTGESGNDGE